MRQHRGQIRTDANGIAQHDVAGNLLYTCCLAGRFTCDSDHDYEPGDTQHPMSSDPDCRICGKTRGSCER
jgi:hypothetical protein